jgi:TRAP-type mannitol/chloroaromatic compound transport system substrate-binding protein
MNGTAVTNQLQNSFKITCTDHRIMKAVTKTTEAFPLNSEMYPGTYQISLETVKEMTGGKFDVENLVVYDVEGLCNIYYI